MPLRLATTHCGHAPAGSGTVCFASRTTRAHLRCALRVADVEARGKHPRLARPAALAPTGNEALLRELERGRAACSRAPRRGAARRVGRQSRETPGRCASSFRGERGEKIVGGRVAPRVLRHIAANAVAELVGAEPLLEHGEDRLALRVRDAVERGADVARTRSPAGAAPRAVRKLVDVDRLRALERAPPARPLRTDFHHELAAPATTRTTR